jgi:hypothetical protein
LTRSVEAPQRRAGLRRFSPNRSTTSLLSVVGAKRLVRNPRFPIRRLPPPALTSNNVLQVSIWTSWDEAHHQVGDLLAKIVVTLAELMAENRVTVVLSESQDVVINFPYGDHCRGSDPNDDSLVQAKHHPYAVAVTNTPIITSCSGLGGLATVMEN